MDTEIMDILFCKYGEAVFRAECLEMTISEILRDLSGDIKGFRDQRSSFFFNEKIEKNIKRLLDLLQSRFPVTGEMEAELKTALQKRNWLIHDYWLDRNVIPDEPEGEKIQWMRDELQELSDLFLRLDVNFRQLAGI